MGNDNQTKPINYNTPTHEQLKKALTTRTSQRVAILKHLKLYGSLSTLQAHQAGIMAPAVRIKELREAGHQIQTVKDWNLNGMATYHLIKLARPKAKAVPND